MLGNVSKMVLQSSFFQRLHVSYTSLNQHNFLSLMGCGLLDTEATEKWISTKQKLLLYFTLS